MPVSTAAEAAAASREWWLDQAGAADTLKCTAGVEGHPRRPEWRNSVLKRSSCRDVHAGWGMQQTAVESITLQQGD